MTYQSYYFHDGTDGWFNFQISLSEINLKNLQIKSKYFLITTYKSSYNGSNFKLFFIVPGESARGALSHVPEGEPETSPSRVACIEWGPKQHVESWTWNLHLDGEFPFEKYQMIYLIGFNKSINLEEAAISITVDLSPALAADWRVNITFTHLENRPTNSTLHKLGINPIFFQEGSHDIIDFYLLTINLVRREVDIFRLMWLSWIPSLGILCILIASIPQLLARNPAVINLYLTILVSIVALILALISYLPPYETLAENLFYADIGISLVFMTIATLVPKAKRKKSKCSSC